MTHIVIRKVNVISPLHRHVHQPVDNSHRVQMQLMRTLFGRESVINPAVLFLKKRKEFRPVMSPITLGPQTNPIVGWLVVRKLKEPGLGKMPERMRGLGGAVGRVRGFARTAHSDAICQVGFGNGAMAEVGGSGLERNTHAVGTKRAVGGNVIGKTDLGRLVNIQHVHFVVPAPGVEICGLGVGGDKTRSILLKRSHHG